MNRDTTIIQVAILFIIIAILWVAIFNKQLWATQPIEDNTTKTVIVQPIHEWAAETILLSNTWNVLVTSWVNSVVTNSYTERMNSPRTNLVKQYFAAIANKEYEKACSLMSNAKCANIRPWAVENFTIEFDKLKNGYEYINIKDYDITAPSGKEIVCVKYSYRYKDDPNPQLISEILSFYTQQISWQLRISDRVCEKKYKEWSWIRPCPIEPYARFCQGKIR